LYTLERGTFHVLHIAASSRKVFPSNGWVSENPPVAIWTENCSDFVNRLDGDITRQFINGNRRTAGWWAEGVHPQT
jgi:hypothetical protein